MSLTEEEGHYDYFKVFLTIFFLLIVLCGCLYAAYRLGEFRTMAKYQDKLMGQIFVDGQFMSPYEFADTLQSNCGSSFLVKKYGSDDWSVFVSKDVIVDGEKFTSSKYVLLKDCYNLVK